MTENTRTIEEQAVLDAARALGAVQLSEVEYTRRWKAADEHRLRTVAELVDAESELAAADLDHATANYTVDHLQQRVRAFYQPVQKAITDAQTACEHLWSVASSAEDDLILKAAESYGECIRTYQQLLQEDRRLRSELEAARAALQAASEARRRAVQNREKAKAADEAAYASLMRCVREGNDKYISFAPERTLVEAAQALTGTVDIQYNYTLTETSKLPIHLPENVVSESAVAE